MLLLWCLSMIQVFSYPLGERSFHLFVDLKQAIVSVSGGLSPHNLEMCSISPQQACSFRCWFSNNSVQSYFVRMLFKNSFMVGDVGFILRSIHSNYLTTMHCFRRHCDIVLFDPSSCFVKIIFFPCVSI